MAIEICDEELDDDDVDGTSSATRKFAEFIYANEVAFMTPPSQRAQEATTLKRLRRLRQRERGRERKGVRNKRNQSQDRERGRERERAMVKTSNE